MSCFDSIFSGCFCAFCAWFSLLEGMLLGSIISSTDAASVFSILRSQKVSLKNNLAPMLEMESGSNDHMAYMLTVIFLGMITGEGHNVGLLLLTQILVGVLFGVLVARGALWLINRIDLEIDGLYSILVIGVALLSYSGANLLSGNGFLAVYITGLIMGNSKLIHKISLVRYFDGLSWLMQILLFMTLGLLVFPSRLISVALMGILVGAFLIFVARPLAVFLLLTIFKRPIKEQLLVSWSDSWRGLDCFCDLSLIRRSSYGRRNLQYRILVAVASVLVQGTLFIPLAKNWIW